MKKVILILISVMFILSCSHQDKDSKEDFVKEQQEEPQEKEAPDYAGENIISDEEETTINEELPISNDERLCKQAYILSDHLINYAITFDSKNGNTELTNVELYRFFTSTFIYRDNEYHPYNNLAEIPNELQHDVYYSLESVQQMLSEVFGVENWFFNPDSNFEEETKKYHTSSAAGFGGVFSYENMQVTITDDIIEVKFLLTDQVGFKGEPGWDEYGLYKIYYKRMENNGHEFLRFYKLEKADS